MTLLARQFGDTKIVQLQAVRAALEANDTPRAARIDRPHRPRVRRAHRARERAPLHGRRCASRRCWKPLEARLREALGPGTELRVAPGRGLLLVRVEAAGTGYWVGFPLPPRPQAEDYPSRAALWSLILATVLLAAAFAFARYLARPLRELERDRRAHRPRRDAAAAARARPLGDRRPSIAASTGWRPISPSSSSDRALLLAGVSHDLRTPLARLRLGIEMEARDDATRAGMVDDIEEMDRIIGQFLEFARTNEDSALEPRDPNAIVAACVDRYARTGKDVRFAPGAVPLVPLRPTALSRLVANLIDNAIAYGAPPVEVTTRAADGRVVLDVADRGPGIAPGEVERLKQPFTRASAARTDASGVAGAGLGLAIVERIARLHGGTFELLPRDGGGTVARVTIPVAP